jgi:hypothetical protein
MERRLSKTFVRVMLAAGLLVVPGPILAGEEDGAHREMPAKGKPVAGPETAGGILQAVKAREGELDNLIKAKELGKVHEVAFAIRDLVAGLPEKSGQLSAEQQAKLKGNVKYVATIAERLDAAGDAKNQGATEAGFKQLQSVLGAIEGLYPPEALK